MIVPDVGFGSGQIDRADHLRLDAAALAGLASDWRSRLLILDGLDPRVDDAGGLAWATLAEAREDDGLIFLGLDDGRARFVALPAAQQRYDPMARHVWPALAAMPPADAALYATARSLVDWHNRHRFCSLCGQPTAFWRGGWGRRCGCGADHYPRTDPVVIMLAEHEDRVLVGRQASWPPGRYSALAGFLEPGESIEAAVARELAEEAGVTTTAVRYVASQPWPFPCSLMIAAIATVTDPALTLAADEIEDAFWVTKDEVRAALAGEAGARFVAPPRFAIAWTLLSRWVGEG